MGQALDEDDVECKAMVAERNLGEHFVENASGSAIEGAIQRLTHVRLDREGLTSLKVCQYVLTLPNLTHLYLQENELQSLQEIQKAKNLTFLILAGNCITQLEGLLALSKLVVLDISDNEIVQIDAEKELPKSVCLLNIVGNPCCLCQLDLRDHLKYALPNLKELDGEPLTDDESECDETEHKEKNNEPHIVDQNEPQDEVATNLESELKQNKQPINADERIPFPWEKCLKASSMAQRIGTPSPLERLRPFAQSESTQNQLPCPSISKHEPCNPDVQSRDLEQPELNLQECLLQTNGETDLAVEQILASTCQKLDHWDVGMMDRLLDRVKNLDTQLAQELAELFFAPRLPKLSESSKTSILTKSC